MDLKTFIDTTRYTFVGNNLICPHSGMACFARTDDCTTKGCDTIPPECIECDAKCSKTERRICLAEMNHE